MRGGLIDLFPMGSPVPYRVDLFDDEIDSIRTFDPDTPAQPLPGARSAPAAGPRVPDGRATRARAFAAAGASCSRATRPRSRIYKDIGNGIATAGIEYYLPLFFDETATVFDYLGERRHAWCCTARSTTALQRFWNDTRERYRFLQHDRERPVLPPEALFLKPEQFFAACRRARAAGAARARATMAAPGRAPCPT